MDTINDALKQLRAEGLFAHVFSISDTTFSIDCSIYITDLETGAVLQVDSEECDCHDNSHSSCPLCPLCYVPRRDLVQKMWRGRFRIENNIVEQLVWNTGPHLPKVMGESMGQKICAAIRCG